MNESKQIEKKTIAQQKTVLRWAVVDGLPQSVEESMPYYTTAHYVPPVTMSGKSRAKRRAR